MIGCELTLFNPGYLPGTYFYDRIRRLARPGPRQLAAFARLPKRLNAFLAEAAEAARGQFGGPLTYASGAGEPVDWSRFDIVSVDAYRDARNIRSFRADLRKRVAHGKPVAATEFGCCAYAGAAERGSLAGGPPGDQVLQGGEPSAVRRVTGPGGSAYRAGHPERDGDPGHGEPPAGRGRPVTPASAHPVPLSDPSP